LLPGGGLSDQLLKVVDAAIKASGGQHADLDLYRLQPARVFGNAVELQSAQYPSDAAVALDPVCRR
jgi:hypothetical protein